MFTEETVPNRQMTTVDKQQYGVYCVCAHTCLCVYA